MKTYVSSACIPEADLATNVRRLYELGYENIELTGGLHYEPAIGERLANVLSENPVSLQLHNYSPPPQKDFVLNLGALDTETYEQSRAHVAASLELAREQSLGKYAVHAGFYIPILPSELGKRIKKRELFDTEEVFQQFTQTLNALYPEHTDILYVENNVVSAPNFEEYGRNPFMFTHYQEYLELKAAVPELKILLDFAHLKVSCQSLGLNFEEEAGQLNELTDYLHISDNDGLSDSNQGLHKDSEMYSVLKNLGLGQKTITLEVYSGLDDLRNTFDLIEELR